MEEVERLCKLFSIPILEQLDQFSFVKDQVTLVPYLFAKERLLLPLEDREDLVIIAAVDPFALEALKELRLLLGKEIEVRWASKQLLESAIERCYHHKEEEQQILFDENVEGTVETTNSIEGYDLLEKGSANPVIRILNMIILEAITGRASDIHFEPLEKGLSVRFRIDGVLQEKRPPPPELQTQLLTRLKVLANLDIAEQRLPQDGRIKLRLLGREIDFRLSTIPISFGERIVLRILDRANVLLGLDQIAMRGEILKGFRKLIDMPEGIILVTGPTGSGKTTTLYSAISELNSKEVNIMTIEDPVEYKLPGIAQMAVNPKINLHFATGLRHILRQDPDVIMIGEIRDQETAQIAIQASLTGHLVLSTLHTNDAPSALTRLADMGIERYLLTSSILGILAQRLVRKLCSQCAVPYIATDEELAELRVQGVEPRDRTLYKGGGCEHCFHTGYKGRMGIYELMSFTPALKRQTVKSADAEVLRQIFSEEQGSSLRKSGALLASEGVTSLAEVMRSTRMLDQEV